MSAFFALLLFNCAGPEPADPVDSESPPGCEPAVEVCNGFDDDCDGEVDLPLPLDAPLWYVDLDGDGHGVTGAQVQACDPPAGYAPTADDCDDTRPGVYPGAPDPDRICGDGFGDCTAAGECRYAGVFDLANADAVIYGSGENVVGGNVRGVGDLDDDSRDDLVSGVWLLGWSHGGSIEFDAAQSVSVTDGLAMQALLYGDSGDFNGDGRPDLLYGRTDPAPDEYRQVTIFPGPVSGVLDAAGGWRIDDVATEVSAMVAWIGDIDADGFDDVAFGCGSTDLSGTSTVCVRCGETVPERRTPDMTLYREQAEDWSGSSLSNVADTNGDGMPDFGIGALSLDAAADNAGAIYVYTHLPDDGSSLADADSRLLGANAFESAGFDLDGAGDVNGDGYADILVGNRTSVGTSETVEQLVAATLVLGPVPASMSLADAEARFLAAEGFEGNLGMRVRGLGDLDGDTRAEMGLGSYMYGGWDWNGSVLVYAGGRSGTVPLEDADIEFRSEQDGAYIGYHFDGVGDIDGDGRDDLAFGDPNYDPAGRVFLVTGHTW